MSKLKSLEPQEEAYKVIKAERRHKKESNDKKKSKSKTADTNADADAEASAPADADSEVEDDVTEKVKKPKKRKREELPDEIEVDINLPEPPSKKAARKAKKAKTTPATEGTGTTTTADGTSKTDENGETTDHAGKRSDYGVWIGNLPWSATKETLRTFLTEESEIKEDEITRVHMPPPKTAPRADWKGPKPMNRGFAYVDFSTQLAMYSAIALTETKMDHRALLIKNAKSFEGRPDKPQSDETLYDGKGREKQAKAPSKKVFVGNLAFETSKEDLTEHFAQCGTVKDIHMATFEDSGKSKGYAWVSFNSVEAATSAVNGFVYKLVELDSSKKKAKDDSDDEAMPVKSKKRKWKLNKLMGRDLRVEFAEDGTTRYQKRFAKSPKEKEGADFAGDDADVHPQRKGKPFDPAGKPFVPRGKPSGRPFQPRGKVDPRTIRPGAAHANAPRASAAIVESTGKKTTF
jgi:RNA recognition motif-containing protein